ncbi:MAG: ArsR family transcriptional regulator [Lachnospiraceae bacterium]|nr:ArsR family transcriptional regulator [Lachnospiraceae bacterium]
MKYISDLAQAVPLFKCLGSDTRIAIMEMLSSKGPLPMSAIAENLGITAGSLSLHIKQLNECGLINIKFDSGRHGLQRICSIADEKIVIDFESRTSSKNFYETEIGVGLYSDYDVYPTCGISTNDHLIGTEDEPRFFSSPERVDAEILWFTTGHVEYIIPNYLEEDQLPIELLISFEIASEAPGIREDWPSDIQFAINSIPVCMWTSPGDFGKNPGIYTPDWWDPNWNQYGLLKFLSVSETGTYIDGVKVSDITLQDLKITAGSTIRLRMSVSDKSEHKGGLTLYGRSFGNYPQDIKIRMHYKIREAGKE